MDLSKTLQIMSVTTNGVANKKQKQ